MTIVYSLEPHLKHDHMKFALVCGLHYEDFPIHQHDFSELFIVVSGTGNHSVAGYSYPMAAGDVFVINGQAEHGFSDVENLVLLNLMFESQTPLFETPKLKLLPGYQALFNIEPVARQKAEYTARLNLNEEQNREVLRLFNAIEDEYHNAPVGFETMLNSLLQQLMVTLSRYYQGDNVQTNSSTMILSRALVYLEQHFQNNELRTEQIASAAFVSVRQLERLFRHYLETSPNQYIRHKRIQYAKELLMAEPTLSIQRVADRCGFSDSNYFSKCFKQELEVSPRSFRQST